MRSKQLMVISRKGPILLSLVLTILFFTRGAIGGTTIPGGIVSGFWTMAGSPYQVLGDIYVPAQSELVIESGVTVEFASFDEMSSGIDTAHIELTVYGMLTANPGVLLRGQSANPGSWYGIVVRSITVDPEVILTGATIRHAKYGLDMSCQLGPLSQFHGASFLENEYGIYLRDSYWPKLDGMRVADNSIGLLISGGEATLTNLIVQDNTSDGIRIINVDLDTATPILVINSSIHRNGGAGLAVAVGSTANVSIINSLVTSNGKGLEDRTGGGNRITSSYTDVFGNVVDRVEVPAGLGDLNEDPLYVNSSTDLRLQPASPAIDVGTSAGAPSIDYDGVTRPKGCCIDLGAFEFERMLKADFNNDGQEDILWRYYGTGGYNRAWYLGNTGGAGQALALGAEVTPNSTTADPQPKEKPENRAPANKRATGPLAERFKVISPRSSRNPMAATNRRIRSGMIDDPRRAGGAIAKSSGISIADPRLVDIGYEMPFTSDVKLGATPSVLGGGDVMPVGEVTWQIVGTGDFNNDTHVDILWRYNGAGGANVVWYMDGVNWAGSAALISVPDLTWQVVGTGDFNNDSHVDILWRNNASGTNVVWYMNGVNWTGSAEVLGVADTTWQIAGTGDFNKDGKVDVLWRNYGSGGYDVVWYMDGVNWSSSVELIHVGDQNWQIMGTGDYNNDGNVDILWRYNGTGGYNVIWYMNGVNWVESAELIPVPDLNWKIVSR